MDQEEKIKQQKNFLIKVAYWSVWGIGVFLLIKLVGAVLLPFLFAFLVAWGLCTPVDFVANRMHVKRKLAATVLVLLFYAGVGLLLYILGSRIVTLVQDIFNELSAFFSGTLFPMLEQFFAWTDSMFTGKGSKQPGVEDSAVVMERAGRVLSGISGKAIEGVSGVAACIPGLFMKIVIAVIATVFMELEFHDIKLFLENQIPEKWKKAVLEGKSYCMGTMGKCIASYGAILGLTFVELAAGFLILGIDGAIVIAALIACMDILPVLGTGTVLIPWSVIAFTTGNIKMGAGILILYLLITVVRNIVEPKLVGKQMGLSPVVMLPCMLVGLKLFGIVGLIVVPFAVALWKNVIDHRHQ